MGAAGQLWDCEGESGPVGARKVGMGRSDAGVAAGPPGPSRSVPPPSRDLPARSLSARAPIRCQLRPIARSPLVSGSRDTRSADDPRSILGGNGAHLAGIGCGFRGDPHPRAPGEGHAVIGWSLDGDVVPYTMARGKAKLLVELEPSTDERLRRAAEKRSESLRQFVEEAILARLASIERRPRARTRPKLRRPTAAAPIETAAFLRAGAARREGAVCRRQGVRALPLAERLASLRFGSGGC
jgi:hypothetical protein